MSLREDPSPQPLVEPLTRREREILGLLAEGLAAAEIADRLTLALSSVKWYVQQAYGKLGVNNKKQALARAAELGLLGTSRDQHDAAPRQTTEPAPRHNLPLEVTRFFGREVEIEHLRASLRENRLVTLVGSGGVGKTRLSLRAAESLVDDFRDGVWLIELAPLTDPAIVPHLVAAVLGIQEQPGQPMLETVARYLRGRHLLLLLDNGEHLLAACAQLADRILRTCPRVTVLASSREPLGVPGEAVFSVPSLTFPGEGQGMSLEQLADFPAVRLFVDRARLVRPDFQIRPDNAAALVRICQRLDGIPLALELAAARLRLLDSHTLAARLDDAFAVLTGGSRTALPRQQTLRATLDWSYRLLNDEERLLLQRLAVFAGGCTLEAAEAICSGDGLVAGQVLDRLAALVDKSMVNAERKPGEDTRYHLLETVRQYAREKLNDAGESPRLHSRHLDYYRSFAEGQFPKMELSQLPPWSDPIRNLEAPNFRQALQWSFGGQGQPEGGVRLLVAIGPHSWAAPAEAMAWHRRAVAACEAHPEIPALLYAKELECASIEATRDEPPTSLAWATRAVEISRQLGNAGRETLMWNLYQLSNVLMGSFEENEQALGPHEEAEAILRSLGPDHYERQEGLRVQGHFAVRRAELATRRGQYAEAKVHAAETVRLFEAGGSPLFAWWGHYRMGEACARLGEYPAARECFLALKDSGFNMLCLLWLARVDAYSGELARGQNYCRELIVEAEADQNGNMLATGFGTLAIIFAKQSRALQTAHLSGAAAAMYARQKRPPWEDSSLDTLLPGWREGPDAAAIQQAYDAGQAMTSGEAVAYALADAEDEVSR
jgi:predicted ATPase/DNA-binding CsgD family transcriptional regulator